MSLSIQQRLGAHPSKFQETAKRLELVFDVLQIAVFVGRQVNATAKDLSLQHVPPFKSVQCQPSKQVDATGKDPAIISAHRDRVAWRAAVFRVVQFHLGCYQ